MDCDAVRGRLVLLAEGELPAEDALAVRAHLGECAACAAARRETEGLAATMRSWGPPPALAGLRERLAVALDAVDGSKLPGSRRSPWETAAFYVAAAAVLVLAFALASLLPRPGGEGLVAKAPSALVQPTPGMASGPKGPPSAVVAPGPAAATAGDEAKAVEEAIKKLQEAQKKKELADRERALLTPPSGTGISGPEPGLNGKPPGTFGVPESETPGGPTKAPTRPTVIDLSFLPPESPATGATANGVVEIVSREDIPHTVVRATGDEGLAIDKRDGVLYEGPLRAGESVRVPLPMVASTPGSHEINLSVDSDAPGGNARLKVFVPGFVRQPAAKPAADAADRPVSLVFQNASIRQALMDIANQGHLRLEMAAGLGTERISRDVRGVPARAALRAVAEAGGYTVTEKDGVFSVSRGGDTRH